jgi:hypothetical protein
MMIVELGKTHLEQPNPPHGGVEHPILCLMGWVGLIDLSDAQTQPTTEAPKPYLKKVKKN